MEKCLSSHLTPSFLYYLDIRFLSHKQNIRNLCFLCRVAQYTESPN